MNEVDLPLDPIHMRPESILFPDPVKLQLMLKIARFLTPIKSNAPIEGCD